MPLRITAWPSLGGGAPSPSGRRSTASINACRTPASGGAPFRSVSTNGPTSKPTGSRAILTTAASESRFPASVIRARSVAAGSRGCSRWRITRRAALTHCCRWREARARGEVGRLRCAQRIRSASARLCSSGASSSPCLRSRLPTSSGSGRAITQASGVVRPRCCRLP